MLAAFFLCAVHNKISEFRFASLAVNPKSQIRNPKSFAISGMLLCR
jgi:hypothetical protein